VTTQSSERESLSRLPAYIDRRNRLAAAAGLTRDKQILRDGALSSWYSGSDDQFRASGIARIPSGFVFPQRTGGRNSSKVRVFCPGTPHAELRCTVVRLADGRLRLSIAHEPVPVSVRSCGGRIEIYKYCDLREGANGGPATVYIGTFAALHAAGIAPREAEHERHSGAMELRAHLWLSQPLKDKRHRFVIYHEAEARARAQDEDRARSNFKTPAQYQDWLLEVAAASIDMLRRQLRVKTRRRFVYAVPARTVRELEIQFARLRKTLARSDILVEKEDLRAERQRADLRRAALAAMRDADFQRFLALTLTRPSARKR
jgi:hypothetical protein